MLIKRYLKLCSIYSRVVFFKKCLQNQHLFSMGLEDRNWKRPASGSFTCLSPVVRHSHRSPGTATAPTWTGCTGSSCRIRIHGCLQPFGCFALPSWTGTEKVTELQNPGNIFNACGTFPRNFRSGLKWKTWTIIAVPVFCLFNPLHR
jgi:hypothetical protein